MTPPDPRWPSHVYQTGYWFTRPQKEWKPRRDLLDFLEGGDKPIAVSLGVMSMSGKRAQIILRVLERTSVRTINQGWDEAIHGGLEIPKTVYQKLQAIRD